MWKSFYAAAFADNAALQQLPLASMLLCIAGFALALVYGMKRVAKHDPRASLPFDDQPDDPALTAHTPAAFRSAP